MKHIFKEWLVYKENQAEPIIINTTENDAEEILTGSFVECFPDYKDEETLEFVKEATDWSISLKAVDNEKIVGFYLLGTRPLHDTIDSEDAIAEPNEKLDKYKKLKGIEGIALGVIPSYRKTGLASRLLEKVRQMQGLDYIYGMQYKSLNNLDKWTQKKNNPRRLVAQSFKTPPPEDKDAMDQSVYVTLEDLPKK
jgi:GNAT superfamily N-acetyltransferase